jgi:hypothetical protein
MLAPFVTDLLIACTFLLLAGWANEVAAGWLGVARQTGSRDAHGVFNRRRRIDDDGLSVCGSCGLSGDWLFKLDHPERHR